MLTGIPQLLDILWLGFPGALLHFAPRMFNIIHVRGLRWPTFKYFDLFQPKKFLGGSGSMTRCTILLKHLAFLVVSNVAGCKNLLIFNTVNVAINSADFSGTTIPDVALHHYLSTSKLDSLLCVSWIKTCARWSTAVLTTFGV